MPVTLSLVLVVRREQAYLEEFATAALAHAGDAIELLAVDDAASAHAPAVLDRLAAADPRVRVLRLPERAGLGAARAAALAQAAGEYVWFADGGDLIPGLGAAAVLERLRRTRPDVLLVHHTRVSDSGAERPGPHRRALVKLERAEPAPMGDRLAVGALAATLYDKVFRTAALAGLAVDDDDTGLAVTWAALHAATRIDALAVPAYQRRVRPMVRRGDDPDAQFAGYDAAFAALGDLAPGTRRMVATAMLRHQLELLRALPAAEQRPFLARMAESWRAHAEGVTPSARPDRLYAAVAARGDHRGFRVLEAALAARRAARRRRVALYRRRRRALKAARRRREERRYKAELRKPIDPDLAVFAAYWFRGYQCNPRAIYEAARELVPGMRGVWVVRPDGAKELPEGVEHVAPNTPEYFSVLARARYFVNNVNFPDHLVKRPGTTHVMTHHGTPLKYMGLDERRSPVTKMDFERLAKRCSRWDFSITANPHTSLIWERVYPYDHETLEVGYPRNDVLATAGPAEVAAARAELGLEDGQTAVLYAPTHRDGDPGFVPVLDLGPLAD
jgi:CDP-glycerol glycerophosphotransferase